MSNPMKECPICYGTSNLEKKFGCEHSVCKDCFSNQLRSSMSVYMRCPICNNDELGDEMTEKEVRKLVLLNIIDNANKGNAVNFSRSNGEIIEWQIGDMVLNKIPENLANELADKFAEERPRKKSRVPKVKKAKVN